MMKRLLIVITTAALMFGGAFAQAKLDPQGQKMVRELKAASDRVAIKGHAVTPPASTLTIVSFSDAAVLDEIESLGATIRDRRNGLAIVEMPVAEMEQISKFKKVKYISTAKKVKVKNDLARAASNVDAIRNGITNPEKPEETLYFDGTGVVVGLMDTGLDPNHVAFHDAAGNSRVKGISVFSGSSGSVTRYTTDSEIASFTAENEDETHGTHVLGMMAGSYTGGDTDFSGVASGSDIYVTCGDLYNYNILLGIIDVCDYAESVGKPAVVNLSLGGNDGQHDEYDQMCQYIDQIVSGYEIPPIVCIAAGNEGDSEISIVREFTNASRQFRTAIGYPYGYPYVIGKVEFYGDDETPFTVTPFICNSSGGIQKTLTSLTVSDTFSGTLSPSFSSLDISDYFRDYGTPFEVTAQLTNGSNRFSVIYDCYAIATNTRYHLGFLVEGSPGHKIYCYHGGDYGTEFSNVNNSAFITGNGDGTFNSMACGRRIVAVGAYNTRYSWTSIDGYEYSYGDADYEADKISPFSSWGTLWDGREMPHIVAPGCGNVSSVSTYNINSTGGKAYEEAYIVRVDNLNGRDNHWAIMQGTSMATPHTCGIMALWKQLVPELTPEDAVQVAQTTARNDQYTGTVQAGAGKIDAYAGLLELMERTGVEQNIARKLPTVLIATNADGSISIAAAEADSFRASVVSPSGAIVKTVTGTDGRATIATDGLQKGVYIVTVNGGKVAHSQKIVVR